MRSRFRLTFDSEAARDAASLLIQESARALHAAKVAIPESQAALNNAEALKAATEGISSAINALSSVESGVIDLGSVVVIKITRGGESAIAVHQITAVQRAAIDRVPELKNDANTFWTKLALVLDVGAVAEIGGGDRAADS